MNEGPKEHSGIIAPGTGRIHNPGVPPGAVPITKIVDDIVEKVLEKVNESGIVKEMADRIERIEKLLEKKDDGSQD